MCLVWPSQPSFVISAKDIVYCMPRQSKCPEDRHRELLPVCSGSMANGREELYVMLFVSSWLVACREYVWVKKSKWEGNDRKAELCCLLSNDHYCSVFEWEKEQSGKGMRERQNYDVLFLMIVIVASLIWVAKSEWEGNDGKAELWCLLSSDTLWSVQPAFLLLFCSDLTVVVDWVLKNNNQSMDIYPIVLLLCTKKKQGAETVQFQGSLSSLFSESVRRPGFSCCISLSILLLEVWSVVVVVVDRFYIVLFSVLEQTHCTRMWFYMSE